MHELPRRRSRSAGVPTALLALGVLSAASAATLASPPIAALKDDDVARRIAAQPIDVNEDLVVTTDPQNKIVTVTSPRGGFTLGLPYFDRWIFDGGDGGRLGAVSDVLSLDVRPRRREADDPWLQTDEFIDELVGSRADLRFPQIVEEDDRHVACVQVRTAEDKPWHWLYLTVVPQGEAWLQLTLIDTGSEPHEPYDLDLVRLIAERFAALDPAEPDDPGDADADAGAARPDPPPSP